MAKRIHEELIQSGIGAGSIWDQSNLFHLANLFSIPGDHLEIGTLHGASAIAVALAKKRAGVPGEVYCLDPLSGRPDNPYINQTHPNARPELEIVLANAERFGIKLNIIQKKSYPWPKELEARTFQTAYIDGDHRYPWPKHDWINVRDRTVKYIAFDDYNESWGFYIKKLISLILATEASWELVLKHNKLVILGRVPASPPVEFGTKIDMKFGLLERIDDE